MLSGLNDVPWAHIQTAFGTAEEVPQLLTDLLSGDLQVQQAAMNALREEVNHQASVYEVSGYVVPFFVELLVSKVRMDRIALVEMLYSWTRIVRSSYPAEDRAATHQHMLQALQKAIPDLLRLLADRTRSIQRMGFMMLALLPTDHSEVAPALIAFLKKQKNNGFLTDLFGEIAFYARVGMLPNLAVVPSLLEQCRTYLSADHPSMLQVEAAFVVIYLSQMRLTEDTQRFLENVMRDSIPYNLDAQEIEEICDLLAVLPRQEFIPFCVRVLPSVNIPYDAHVIGRLLLDGLFKDVIPVRRWNPLPMPHLARSRAEITTEDILMPMRDTVLRVGRYYESAAHKVEESDLMGEQRHILHLLLQTEPFWKVPTNLLEHYGLPADRQNLQRFLEVL
ncbi:MAG: hypothetical protein IPO91_12240 [Chloroflexi bacterium]|nr:hypothetical protein [Chloroflexota bacterium]